MMVMVIKERKNEFKIVFFDGEHTRAIRGEIVSEEGDFFILRRNDGIHRINKRYVVAIHPSNGGMDDGLQKFY